MNAVRSLPRPLVLAIFQILGQSKVGCCTSTLTGSSFCGEVAVAGVMRTLSSISIVYHCLVVIVVILRLEFSL